MAKQNDVVLVIVVQKRESLSEKGHLCEGLTFLSLQSIGVTNPNCCIRVMLKMSLGKIQRGF